MFVSNQPYLVCGRGLTCFEPRSNRRQLYSKTHCHSRSAATSFLAEPPHKRNNSECSSEEERSGWKRRRCEQCQSACLGEIDRKSSVQQVCEASNDETTLVRDQRQRIERKCQVQRVEAVYATWNTANIWHRRLDRNVIIWRGDVGSLTNYGSPRFPDEGQRGI